jgi:hypothetical protein
VIFLKIFRPKRPKIGLLHKVPLVYAKNGHYIGFQEKHHFSAENKRKSTKIGILAF